MECDQRDPACRSQPYLWYRGDKRHTYSDRYMELHSAGIRQRREDCKPGTVYNDILRSYDYDGSTVGWYRDSGLQSDAYCLRRTVSVYMGDHGWGASCRSYLK